MRDTDMSPYDQKMQQKHEQERAQQKDMIEAHDEGLHDDLPREFCPECEREKRSRVRI